MKKLFKGKNYISGKWVIGCYIETYNNKQAVVPMKFIEKDGHHILIDSEFPWWIDSGTLRESITEVPGKTELITLFEEDLVKVEFTTGFGETKTITGKIMKKEKTCEYVILDTEHPGSPMKEEYSLHFLLGCGRNWEIIDQGDVVYGE